MANTLAQEFTLITDGGLLQRVEMAAVASAIAILNEGTGVAFHTQRATFAKEVIAAPDATAKRLIVGVVADGTTDGTATDAALQTRVNAIWNAYAGAVA